MCCLSLQMFTFSAMVLLWVTRNPPGGWGWSRLLSDPDDVTDGTVAMMCCLFLLIVPVTPTTFSLSSTHHATSTTLRHNAQYAPAALSDHDILEDSSVHFRRRHHAGGEGLDYDEEHQGVEMVDSVLHTASSSIAQSPTHRHSHHNVDHNTSKPEEGGILSWSAVQELNWDVIFLLGGGFALSKGFQLSGLRFFKSCTT
jgi:hypothetical protein